MTNFWNVKDKKREFLSHTQNNIKLFSNTHCTLPSHQPSYLTQSIKETKLVLDTQSRTYQHILQKEVFIFGMELVLEPFLVCVTLDNFIDTSSLCHTHTCCLLILQIKALSMYQKEYPKHVSNVLFYLSSSTID